MADILRQYKMLKYVTARDAAEAMKLSKRLPVCEVIEMKDSPQTQNDTQLPSCIGFQMVYPEGD